MTAIRIRISSVAILPRAAVEITRSSAGTICQSAIKYKSSDPEHSAKKAASTIMAMIKRKKLYFLNFIFFVSNYKIMCLRQKIQYRTE